jgi:CDP-diacylglycerol--glycerol-3-phosphate 3-phosphatidyltransferase
MLNGLIRAPITKILTPAARGLLRLGVTPNMVTATGALGATTSALLLFPTGHLFGGTLTISAFILSDLLDGTMARISGKSSRWGALLDSALDRVGDSAIFGGLLIYYAQHDHTLAVLAGVCLVSGGLVPYVKARAESLGIACDGGIAERAERITAILITTGLSGLGLPYIGAIGLWLIAVATIVTFGQRTAQVWRRDV